MSRFSPSKRTQRVLIILLATLTIVLVYPFESSVAPAWTVQVVDKAGNPLANTAVTQTWHDNSAEWDDHKEEFRTDSNGYVSFPARTIRASVAKRAVVTVDANLHLICGGTEPPYAFIEITDSGAFVHGGFYSKAQEELLPKQVIVEEMGR